MPIPTSDPASRWTELIRTFSHDETVITFQIAPDGIITGAKGPGIALMGLTEEQITGASVFEIYRDTPDIRNAARRALGGEATVGQTTVDGRILQTHYVPFQEEGGKYSVLGIASDVTQQRLEQEEDRLHAEALAATAHAIMITDRTGAITWTNPAFTRLTGYSFEEVRGKNPRETVRSGLQSQEFYASLWQTITAGQVWSGRLVNRRADGGFYHEYQTVTPVKNETGEITHFIAVKIDVSREVEYERQLRDAKERDQAILDALPDMLFRFKRDGTLLDFRPPRGLGLALDLRPHLGRMAGEVLPPAVAESMTDAIRTALAQRHPTVFEFPLPTSSGSQAIHEATAIGLSDEEALIVARDVTEARRHTAEIEQRLKELTALNSLFRAELEEREQLLATVEQSVAELVGIARATEPLIERLADPDADRVSVELAMLIRRLTSQLDAVRQRDRDQRDRFGFFAG